MSGPSACVFTPGPGLFERDPVAFDPRFELLAGVQRGAVQVDRYVVSCSRRSVSHHGPDLFDGPDDLSCRGSILSSEPR